MNPIFSKLEDRDMKKVLAMILVLAAILSLGVSAFADGSPVAPGSDGGNPDLGWADVTTRVPAAKKEDKLVAYDKDGNVIGEFELGKEVAVGNADKLSEEDKEAFLAAYEDAQNIKDSVVKDFFWLPIPKELENVDFAYVEYKFYCAGKNVKLFVNGHEMEVDHIKGNEYKAKLTEFGAIMITCD
jgi:hypothetical protein